MTTTIVRSSISIAAVAVLFGAFAITTAYAQSSSANLVVNVQLATGSSHPGTQATVTVTATGASLGGTPGAGNTLQYSTNFNDTRVVTHWPSSYAVSVASVAGYTYGYGAGCFGTTVGGETRSCTVTATQNGASSGSSRLVVHTTVINNSGGNLQPNNFTIVVTGNNASPASSRGTSGGTTVFLNPGTYSADILSATNYTRSRSSECSGSISRGEVRTCVITLDDTGAVLGAFTSPLTCTPSRQSVLIGQTISFTATGGGPVYNWATANRVYLNAGSRLNIIQETAGTYTVIVSSGHESALCIVDALATSGGGAVKGVSTGPGLPNTGEGGNFALTLLVLALLGGAAALFATIGRRGVAFILSK